MDDQSTTNSAENDTITFIPALPPSLETGVFTVQVHQITRTRARPAFGQPETWEEHVDVTRSQDFHVRVPSASFDPQDIRSVFPPSGSSGDHTRVLPHVVLRRSSLPWERHAHLGAVHMPWLAVLLFTDQDQQEGLDLNAILTPRVMPLSELRQDPNYHAPPASTDNEQDSVSVIHVPRALLEKILPRAEDITWLAHARRIQTQDAQGSSNMDEAAVVFGNRQPHPQGINIAHLVSIEDRYDEHGFIFGNDCQPQDLVPLVTFKSWRFTCLTEKERFLGLVRHLNKRLLFVASAALLDAQDPEADAQSQEDAGLYQKPVPENLRAAFAPYDCLSPQARLQRDGRQWEIVDGAQRFPLTTEKDQLYAYRLDPFGTLRRPPSSSPDAEAYLAQGCVPLAHTARQGNQTVSWYHGPLIPGAPPAAEDQPAAEALPLPARFADALVQYNPEIGMFDVSLAAAWELGRLLTLRQQEAAVDLFNWKRANRHAPAQAERKPPASVRAWLTQLAELREVPFHYLVADELLLPPESLRFFQVDQQWREALLDGAASIGRRLPADAQWDEELRALLAEQAARPLSGFLLRSALVEGYPDLHIEASLSDNSEETSPPLRTARTGGNILLAIFEGVLQAMIIAQKPEWMHFGFENDEDEQPIPWHDAEKRVVNIHALAAQKPPSATSADFALRMIAKTELIRFVRGAE